MFVRGLVFCGLLLASAGGLSLHEAIAGPDGFPLGLVLWGGLALFTAVALLGQMGRVLALGRQVPLLLALLGWAGLTACWSLSPLITLKAFFLLTEMLLLAALAAWFLSPAQVLRLFLWALGLLAVLSLFMALFFPQFGIMEGLHEGRWRGVFGQKNDLGRNMALGLLLALLGLGYLRGRARTACGLLIPLFGFLLLKTESVTAQLVALGVAVLWLGLGSLRALFGARGQPLGLAFAVLGLSGLGVLLARQGFADVLELLGRTPDLTGRLRLWQGALAAWADRPWLGYGLEAFWTQTSGAAYHYVGAVLRWDAPHAHNGLLEVMIGTGAIGAGLMLIVLGLSLFTVWKNFWRGPSLAGDLALMGLLALLAVNVSEVTLLRPNLFWALYLVIVLQCTRDKSLPAGAQGRYASCP